MLVNSYMKSFKLPAIIVRSNNVYGPHQFPESEYPKAVSGDWLEPSNIIAEIIPKFTCLLRRQRPMILHGDGSPTRRYLYAGDAADAFDTILHKGTLGQIYNVGSYDEISNLHIRKVTGLDLFTSTQDLDFAKLSIAPPRQEEDPYGYNTCARYESMEARLYRGGLEVVNDEFVNAECIVATEVYVSIGGVLL